MNEEKKGKNMPEKRFSAGVISATVWKNAGTSKKGEPTEYRTVSLQRRYQDKNGEWQSTNSMRVNDLPKVSLVVGKAYEHIVLKASDAIVPSVQQQVENEIEEIVL